MLVILSGLAPYKPSVENLATEIGVSKNNVPDYLVYLERAGMIGLLRDICVVLCIFRNMAYTFANHPLYKMTQCL